MQLSLWSHRVESESLGRSLSSIPSKKYLGDCVAQMRLETIFLIKMIVDRHGRAVDII